MKQKYVFGKGNPFAPGIVMVFCSLLTMSIMAAFGYDFSSIEMYNIRPL